MPCYKADLHIHSCLSPCGSLEMSPKVIVETLKEKGVQIAALTDHNTALNCPAFDYHCKKNGMIPLFGMEAQTAEEIHVLCLFSQLQTALDFSQTIYDLLPPIMNNPEKAGDQVIVDQNDDIIGEIDKYLVISADITIEELEKMVHELNGLVIPAHIDRASFSMTSQLGFVIEGNWDALEAVRNPPSKMDYIDNKQVLYPIETLGYPITHSSDAHYIRNIAQKTFDLDFADAPLHGKNAILNDDGTLNFTTLKQALNRLG